MCSTESLPRVLHAPSAGFSQGTELLVLTDPDAVAAFWELNEQPDFPTPPEHIPLRPPVVVVVLSNADAYTERYAAPDKIRFGLDQAANWHVPYWDVDAGMATMLILLAVVEEGLGAFFAGLVDDGRPTLDHFGVPAATSARSASWASAILLTTTSPRPGRRPSSADGGRSAELVHSESLVAVCRYRD